jgi:hypothetical protein
MNSMFCSSAQAGRHLVHDAAVDARIVDLGALGDLRQHHVVEFEAEQVRSARSIATSSAALTTGRSPPARSW